MVKRGRRRRHASRALALALIASAGLAGCSGYPDELNPFEWYRDITGASKNDEEDKTARNAENLAAGNEAPYPNLATVPAEPDTAMSTAERERLQKTLAADRANARYSDEQLRQGHAVPPLPGEPPPGIEAGPTSRPPEPPGTAPAPAAKTTGPTRAARGSESPPQESSLATPAVRATPQGEEALVPPPAPVAKPKPRQEAALPPSAAAPRREFKPAPAAPPPVTRSRSGVPPSAGAEITFAADGRTLSGEDRARLSEVAEAYRESKSGVRVIGHSRAAGIKGFDEALDHANAVAQALTQLGVPAGRINVQAAPGLSGLGLAEVEVEY